MQLQSQKDRENYAKTVFAHLTLHSGILCRMQPNPDLKNCNFSMLLAEIQARI
jgi:hypothetical protein